MPLYNSMQDGLNSLLDNKVLLVPLVAWLTAQALKVIVALIRDRRLDFSYIISMGGMPSSHTTLVCALTTTIAVLYGLSSPLFAIAAIFAVIVMYDAAGVRKEVSNQSTLLNRMLDELFKGQPEFEERLKELIGHTKLEVLAGALLGIVFGLVLTPIW